MKKKICIDCSVGISKVSTRCNPCAAKVSGKAKTKLSKVCPECESKKDRYAKLCQVCARMIKAKEIATRTPRACLDCGKVISRKAKARCTTCSGKHRSQNYPPELRDKVAKQSRKQMLERHKNSTQQQKEEQARKMSIAMRKRWQDKEFVERRSKAISGWLSTRTSKVEAKVGEDLLPIGYEQGVRVGRYVVDFINNDTRTIVEVNGDYWHCNPDSYDPDYFHKAKNLTAKEIWEYDNQRNKHLQSLGYDVIIIWEKDIRQPDFCVKPYLRLESEDV